MFSDEERLVISYFFNDKSENTKRSYKNELINFKVWLNREYFGTVTKERAQLYYNYLLNDKGYKKATYIRIIRTLLKFYKVGVEKKIFKENPFYFVKLPAQDFGYIRPDRILDQKDLHSFLTAAYNSSPRDYSMVLLFATSRFTALEIRNLEWGGILHDAYDNWGAKVKTKGRDKYRIIPIPVEAIEALQKYRVSIGLSPQINEVLEKHDKVFLNRYNDPISETGIRKIIYRLCEESAVPMISPMDLSHLAVVYGLIYKANPEKLRKQAGFKNINLLKKYDTVIADLHDAACNVIKLPMINKEGG